MCDNRCQVHRITNKIYRMKDLYKEITELKIQNTRLLKKCQTLWSNLANARQAIKEYKILLQDFVDQLCACVLVAFTISFPRVGEQSIQILCSHCFYSLDAFPDFVRRTSDMNGVTLGSVGCLHNSFTQCGVSVHVASDFVGRQFHHLCQRQLR